MEDIKQRLFQVLQGHSREPFPIAVVDGLARDALAQIEALEIDRDLIAARRATAMEAIAKHAKSIDETLVMILHKLPNANE